MDIFNKLENSLEKMGEAGAVAQQIRALAALPKKVGSIPSTHTQLTAVCNSSPRGTSTLWPLSTVGPSADSRVSIHQAMIALCFSLKMLFLYNIF